MTSRPSSVIFNGKFIAQSVTGVQRFARELVEEVDRLLASEHWITDVPFELVVPSGYTGTLPKLTHVAMREVPAGRLHVWEQLRLPRSARGALLVNLAGSAPLLKRGQVCTFHDAAIFDIPGAYSGLFANWYRLLFRVQGRISRRLLTVSDFSRQRLSHHLRISPDKIGVVPNGATHFEKLPADESVLARFQLRPGRYLLAVGSDNPSKNFAALLAAFRFVKSDNTQFVVVGGQNDAVFSSSASGAPASIDPRIIRTGRLDDAQLKALYANARAFVFPSLYEGFGIPPLEAMVSGCPVLASNATSIPEVCADAAGYFDPNDTGSIRAALERALADDAWLDGLRRAGLKRVAHFTWEAAANRLLGELATLGVVRPRTTMNCGPARAVRECRTTPAHNKSPKNAISAPPS